MDDISNRSFAESVGGFHGLLGWTVVHEDRSGISSKQMLLEKIRLQSGPLSLCRQRGTQSVQLEQARQEASREAHVLGSMAGADSTRVLTEHDAQYPIHAFNSPVLSYRSGKLGDLWETAADVVPDFGGRLVNAGRRVDCLTNTPIVRTQESGETHRIGYPMPN